MTEAKLTLHHYISSDDRRYHFFPFCVCDRNIIGQQFEQPFVQTYSSCCVVKIMTSSV